MVFQYNYDIVQLYTTAINRSKYKITMIGKEYKHNK